MFGRYINILFSIFEEKNIVITYKLKVDHAYAAYAIELEGHDTAAVGLSSNHLVYVGTSYPVGLWTLLVIVIEFESNDKNDRS